MSYWVEKARVDAAGRDTLAMIAEHSLGVFDITGTVDNTTPVVVLDTSDHPDHGPDVTVIDRDGCIVKVHAIRVGLTTDLPIGHPARRQP